ncbi:MAG: peptidyl-prolyl cis-trans isomerase [Verrucomicrobiales bacterium]|nr:peptidyl-prolyl cis-trans isomerase [Verrucomicrobiales bacterium]
MLSQIRHIQKGVLIVVCIVIIIAFAFLYSDYDASSGSANTTFVVYGKGYRAKESRVLSNSFDVAIQLGLYDFVRSLFGEGRQDEDRTDYVLNMVILREEAKRLGVQPSAEEVKKAIPNLPIFKIQRWAGEDYIRNNITGPLGFTDADLYQLVKDYLSWQQIHELLAAGIDPVPDEIERIYTRKYQRISGAVITFSRADEEKKVKVSDEEIEKYYQEHKEDLLSQEKRSASYTHFALPVAKLKDKATKEEQALFAEQKQKDALAFNKKVAEVYEEMAAEGADFAKVAETNKLKVIKTGSITLTDVPKELEGKADVLRAVFGVNEEQALSSPILQADGSYYIVHLDELKAPEPLALKDATEAIVKVLKTRKSGEQLQAAAAKVQASINEALAAGKTFAEAAKAAAVKPVELKAFSMDDPPKEIENARLIVDTAVNLKVKKLSSIVNTPTGAMLVYVDGKVIYKSKEEESRKNMIKGQLSYQDSRTLYQAWFQEKRSAAEPKRSGPVSRPQS